MRIGRRQDDPLDHEWKVGCSRFILEALASFGYDIRERVGGSGTGLDDKVVVRIL